MNKLVSDAALKAIAREVRLLRDAGATWAECNEAVGHPYTHAKQLRRAIETRMCGDEIIAHPQARRLRWTKDAPADNTEGGMADVVSMEWANNPPAGAEAWTDEEWEAALMAEARRRTLAGVARRMLAREAARKQQQKGTTS